MLAILGNTLNQNVTVGIDACLTQLNEQHTPNLPKSTICKYIYIYIYICGFIMLYLQTAILRFKKGLSRIFREPHVYLSRGCSYPLLCCWHTLKQHANGNCMSNPGQPRVDAKAMLGKFHQKIAKFHCLPRSLGLPLQRCSVGYWLPWTPSLSPLLSCNFRETFAKNPLQINRKIHTLNRPWGFTCSWLHYSAWVYSLRANNNSEGSHFT